MKKIYTLMTALFLTMTTIGFTSCYRNDDEDIAYSLEGTWKGYMHITTPWHGEYYQTTYSTITFLKNPYQNASGEGYWVDYYSNAPWDYVANHIEWRVNYHDIIVYFIEEDTEIIIRDYRLVGNRFNGWIKDGNNEVEFYLNQIASPNYNNFEHWGYSGWYRHTRSTINPNNSEDGNEKPRRVVMGDNM